MIQYEIDWLTQAELIVQSLRGFVPIVMLPEFESVIREMGQICHEAAKQKAKSKTASDEKT